MILKRLRFMPRGLRVGFWTAAVAPLGLAAAVAAEGRLVLAQEPWLLGLAAFVYVACPWLLAGLLVKRHAAFPHALIVFSVALFGLGLVTPEGWPASLAYTQAAFIALCAFLALLMVNRDLLFPFLFQSRRGFRRAPRVALNQLLKVYDPRAGKSYDLMLEDCSLSGVALYGQEDGLGDLVATVERGDPLVLEHRAGKTTYRVPMAFMWYTSVAPVVKVGLHAIDGEAMERLVRGLGFHQNYSGLGLWMARFSARRGVRRVVSYAFAVAFIAALAAPPLVKKNVLRLDVPTLMRAIGLQETKAAPPAAPAKPRMPKK